MIPTPCTASSDHLVDERLKRNTTATAEPGFYFLSGGCLPRYIEGRRALTFVIPAASLASRGPP